MPYSASKWLSPVLFLCSLWESTQVLLFRFHAPEDICIKLLFSLPAFAQLVATFHLCTSANNVAIHLHQKSLLSHCYFSMQMHVFTPPVYSPKKKKLAMCVRLFFEHEPLTGLVSMMPDFVALNAFFSWLCSVSQ